MVTIRDAEAVAKKLSEIKGVIGVEVFGSIARKGVGNDLDLILIVDDSLAQAWWSEVRLRVKNHPFIETFHAFKKLLPFYTSLYDEPRRQWSLVPASQILDTDLEEVAGMEIDVMLMPEAWRIDGIPDLRTLAKLEGVCEHAGTLAFLGRVAKVVKRLV